MIKYFLFLIMLMTSIMCFASSVEVKDGRASLFLRELPSTLSHLYSRDAQLIQRGINKNDYQLISGVDNYRSLDLGLEATFIDASYKNIAGQGDFITGRITLVKGFSDYSLKYTFPVNSLHSKLSAYTINRREKIVEQRMIESNVDLDSKRVGLNWLFDQKWGGQMTTSYALGYEKSKTKTQESEEGVGCKAGGECEFNIFVLSANWQRNTYLIQRNASFVLRQGVGVDTTNAFFEDDAAGFTSFSTKGQISRILGKFAGVFRLNTKLQYALNSLIRTEKFSLGGVSSIRGYQENALVRDNGFLLSSEWIKRISSTGIYLTAFVDYGVGWNTANNNNKEQLLSVGGGVAWQGTKSLNTEFFVGIPMLRRPDELSELQDYGVHFAMQYRIL